MWRPTVNRQVEIPASALYYTRQLEDSPVTVSVYPGDVSALKTTCAGDGLVSCTAMEQVRVLRCTCVDVLWSLCIVSGSAHKALAFGLSLPGNTDGVWEVHVRASTPIASRSSSHR